MFSYSMRVYYEDTDGTGVVYHAKYLNYFERARSEWLRSIGFSQQALREALGIAFTVNRLNLCYLRPAKLDDLLIVTVHPTEMRRVSLNLEQTLRREGESTDLCRASVNVVCIRTQSFRPCRLPDKLCEQIVDQTSQPLEWLKT